VRSEIVPEWKALSVREAAERTGYHPEYLRRLIRRGKIEAERFGSMYLIRADSLERYVQEMNQSDDARAGPKRP
jgi:excisionase family DNA binding protein